MTGLPKSKVSKGRRGRRRAHSALNPRSLIECPQCKEKKLPHRVCMNCGYYRGVQVVEGSR